MSSEQTLIHRGNLVNQAGGIGWAGLGESAEADSTTRPLKKFYKNPSRQSLVREKNMGKTFPLVFPG